MAIHERDLSRAHWQRSEAMVLYGRVFDELCEKSLLRMQADDGFGIERALDATIDPKDINGTPLSELQRTAYSLSESFFSSNNRARCNELLLFGDLSDSVKKHTHYEHFGVTMEEVNRTMAHFPLNLAFGVSRFADENGIKGYETGSLAEIGHLLRKADYRQLAQEASLTTNGFWRQYSLYPSLSFVLRDDLLSEQRKKSTIAFRHDPTANVITFTPETIALLHQTLKANNQNPVSEKWGVDSRSSSGCPARHLAPHFTNSEADQKSIEALGEHFGLSKGEVVSQRSNTSIETGLDSLATILERAEHVKSALAVTALAAF